VAAIQEALGRLKPAAFDLVVRGFGSFPGVIWVGCEGPVAPLAEAIENVCASLGFERERRAFHSHVTVGRVKDRRARVTLDPAVEFGRQRVDAFTLMKSELRPTGSVYTELARFPLTG
jgi:2'-5' RNA ligase